MHILAGNSNKLLSQHMASYLGINLLQAGIKYFADGEIFVEIHEHVRGKDVFVVQSTCTPTNDHIMELLICIDALKRSSAKRISAVIPYFGYARQDRRVQPRTPISAKLVANLIATAGADKVIMVDLHAEQVQGFFDIPVDNIKALPVLINDIISHFDTKNLTIVSPDVGGVVRARNFASKLNVDLAIVDKRREKPGLSEVMNIIGNIKGKDCILVDDIVDSAGTLCNAAQALLDQGAKSVNAYATHGVFSQNAHERILNSQLKNLIITDTIPHQNLNNKKIRVVSVAPLLAEVIKRVSEETSIASLFD
ncbi:ribose-phosphate pyrophosphokinase [Rickettsiales endosymbiont of Stachyamoeba lipophora]|uniref:ribose-phosphate pyrophosphokinase n=1 Tax=Rickettsiales endosymbiont of Stachyamoeba lipophora TaxID=2486578 RepID=UPI000F64D5BF|nr:ribose-phosphate pyrophosphokinase [Rickettsiales endosymbiont of Stachyamoeba lipophora]AZL15742.1 ribose-phosphate pyrophosphokinase [Rickettsiales endosymbiont of Stachyamoeba lipophora]